MTKEQLIQELIDAHEKLIAVATAAHERGITRTAERWGPREVLAHIAGWEANAIVRVPKVAAGAPRGKYDDDAFNEAIMTIVGDQSFETIRSMLRRTYQRDVDMLKALDVRFFALSSYAYERTRAAIDHCYEHLQALDEMK